MCPVKTIRILFFFMLMTSLSSHQRVAFIKNVFNLQKVIKEKLARARQAVCGVCVCGWVVVVLVREIFRIQCRCCAIAICTKRIF